MSEEDPVLSQNPDPSSMASLEQELKLLIIDALELEDVTAADIDSNAQLFGGELGLDSIDALELGVVIQKNYDITIDAESDDEKSHFESIATLARFISLQRSHKN